MIFNSLTFLVFALVFFPLYFVTRGRARLGLCLAASYVFYGWWDWRFLSLILVSTLLDWFFGIWLTGIHAPETLRAYTPRALFRPVFALAQSPLLKRVSPRRVLMLSVAMNLGILGFFKYFNFFADNFALLLQSVGLEPSWTTLNIVLPVGISFYTFQSMSYTIDVYRRQLDWEPSLLRFATYIAFFPQLVAGPIVRAADFLPQLRRDRAWDAERFYSGLGRVIWGMFKKVAVADSLGPFADQVFDTPHTFGGLHACIGLFFYAFQIYCDFSGYSDMAIGLARMMGFHFPENFRTPYFSRSFSEFWTRWHVSLSSWLRDYLYIPLGGNRRGVWMTYRNNMLTMLIGGLWHGANWAFVFWGFLHGLYLIVQRVAGPVWARAARLLRLPRLLVGGVEMGAVFGLTLLAWVYFRSGSVGLQGGDSFGTAHAVLGVIFGGEGYGFGAVTNKFQAIKGLLLIGLLLTAELVNMRVRLNDLQARHPVFRAASYALLLWFIALFGSFGANAFIYFQF